MEKKIYLFNALAKLTPDNVSEIYNIELNKWRYANSSEVVVNGEAVSDSIEKQLLMLSDEKGEPNIKDCAVNDRDASGFELDEQLFINEQIAKYRPLLERSKGSTINRGAHLKIKAYIEFVENLAKPKEPLIDKDLLASLYREYKHLFTDETEWYWITRFIADDKERKPLQFDADNKIYILAILDVIQTAIKNKPKGFDFGKIIYKNFGFEYTKAKSIIKRKQHSEFKKISDEVQSLMF
jgi:hypothetical protein